jgi:hypothetical protein
MKSAKPISAILTERHREDMVNHNPLFSLAFMPGANLTALGHEDLSVVPVDPSPRTDVIISNGEVICSGNDQALIAHLKANGINPSKVSVHYCG